MDSYTALLIILVVLLVAGLFLMGWVVWRWTIERKRAAMEFAEEIWKRDHEDAQEEK